MEFLMKDKEISIMFESDLFSIFSSGYVLNVVLLSKNSTGNSNRIILFATKISSYSQSSGQQIQQQVQRVRFL